MRFGLLVFLFLFMCGRLGWWISMLMLVVLVLSVVVVEFMVDVLVLIMFMCLLVSVL